MDEREQNQQEEFNFGLEKVRSLISSIRSREKMNALDFTVEEPEKEHAREETLEKTEEREPKGAEKVREPERERYQSMERDGLSLGL